MGIKDKLARIGDAVTRAATPGKLAYWQSNSFYTLERKGGQVAEVKQDKRPDKSIPFVHGGRGEAMRRAKTWWGDTAEAFGQAEESAHKAEAEDSSLFQPELPGEKAGAEGKGKQPSLGDGKSSQVTRGLKAERPMKPLTPTAPRITPKFPRISGGG